MLILIFIHHLIIYSIYYIKIRKLNKFIIKREICESVLEIYVEDKPENKWVLNKEDKEIEISNNDPNFCNNGCIYHIHSQTICPKGSFMILSDVDLIPLKYGESFTSLLANTINYYKYTDEGLTNTTFVHFDVTNNGKY